MKLVPLTDRVVLKQCRGRRNDKVRHYPGKCSTGKANGGGGYCRRSWRNGRG